MAILFQPRQQINATKTTINISIMASSHQRMMFPIGLRECNSTKMLRPIRAAKPHHRATTTTSLQQPPSSYSSRRICVTKPTSNTTRARPPPTKTSTSASPPSLPTFPRWAGDSSSANTCPRRCSSRNRSVISHT